VRVYDPECDCLGCVAERVSKPSPDPQPVESPVTAESRVGQIHPDYYKSDCRYDGKGTCLEGSKSPNTPRESEK